MVRTVLAKRVNPRTRPGLDWIIDWDWACGVCEKVYKRQTDAMTCCADKKDVKKHPWVEAFIKEAPKA